MMAAHLRSMPKLAEMATASVLYVKRRDAKTLKSRLETESLLDKRFRMIQSASDAIVVLENCNYLSEEPSSDVDAIASGKCIAVPVTDECVHRFERHIKESNNTAAPSSQGSWETYAIASGQQLCPFSSSALGNQNHAMISKLMQQNCDGRIKESNQHNNQAAAAEIRNLTKIQCVLVETMVDYYTESTKKSDNSLDQEELASFQAMVKTSVSSFSIKICPKKLEVMGDDRTLVVPSTAFLLQEQETTNEFHKLLINICQIIHNSHGEADSSTMCKLQQKLWENLANLYQSPRVVRRGDIDPESGVRESGHRILWPLPVSITSPNNDTTKCTNHGYIPQSTGPDSSGWITVTEHKISQSFDLTRVMFSRGNVTEKKRFGLLVQPDEYVLDMYAGIGYYTLPALVHGRARHVTACEWNPNAVFALRHNLKANKVDERATVLEGDCRLTLRALMANHTGDEFHYFDRISLGLLPSSEGGWPIAIECLNRENGGWLHVHGNVATTEREQWAHWLCRSLVSISKKNKHSIHWHAVCHHVERVKSFAPKVDHYVADVFVGPINSPLLLSGTCFDNDVVVDTTGVLHSGAFTATPLDVSAPSCALDTEGVIHQKWMM